MEEKHLDREEYLQGQVAIITGGASGIGQATCYALAKAGADVVVVDIDRDRVERTVREIQEQGNGRVPLGLALDNRKERDMEEMAYQTLARFDRIDILVACAGILRPKGTSPKLMVDLTVDEWNAVLDTNLKGTFLSNRAVLPTMIAQRKGHIINISSTSGRQGRAYDSAYCASKFGVVGLSESLMEEVRQYRLKVHVILPDAVDTPMWDQNGPVPRPSDALPPLRVADLIVYLLRLPEDTVLLNPIITPFRPRRRIAGSQKAPRGIGTIESTGIE